MHKNIHKEQQTPDKNRKRTMQNWKQILPAALAACMLLTACGEQSGNAASPVQETQETRTDAESREQQKETGSVEREAEQQSGTEKKAVDPAAAAEDAVVPKRKEEMISVQADAAGKPEKTEVSGTLSGFDKEDAAYVSDISGLSDLKNADGEEEFGVAEDGTVYWENLGKEIHYEGISDRELPAEVQVTYYLDGKELPPEQIKGKSGSVKIRFDYTVTEKASVQAGDVQREMTVPFLALSLVILPEDVFSDICVTHGKVVTLGGGKAAVGYALPGLAESLDLASHEGMEDVEIPSYVEITADAEEFELDFTATLLQSGLFGSLDGTRLDSLEDDLGAADDLEEAVKELEEAAGKLNDGAVEMQEYVLQYANGVNQVAAAVSAIDQEFGAYDLTALGQLAEQLQLAGLGDAAAQLTQLQISLQALQGSVAQLDQGSAGLPASGQALYDGMTELASGTAEFRDGITEFRQEGIKELTGFFRDDLGELLDRIRGLRLADLQYDGYTPAQEGQEISAGFLIETEGI